MMRSSEHYPKMIPATMVNIIREFQERIAKLCQYFQEVSNQINVQSDARKKLILQQELILCQTQIRTLDKLMKNTMQDKTVQISSYTIRKQGRDCPSACLCRLFKDPSCCENAHNDDNLHPSRKLSKEDFFNSLGLISQEKLKLQKAQPKKMERRRRTATNNSKYTSNGFLKLDVSTKRRRAEIPVTYENIAPVPTVSLTTTPKVQLQCCNVCYGDDYNLSCETCTTKYHSDCIRVTGSLAPMPHRLPLCPKCVQAANTSQRSRMQSSRSKPPLSIMSTSSAAKLREDSSIIENHRLPSPPSRKIDFSSLTALHQSVMKPQVVAKGSSDIMQLLNCREAVPVVSNAKTNISPGTISTATSALETLSNPDNIQPSIIKSNHPITSDTERQIKTPCRIMSSSSAGVRRIEALGPKSKLGNGEKTVRIARVRLNMNSTEDDDLNGNDTCTLASAISVVSPCRNISPSQSALKWQKKLRPKLTKKTSPIRRQIPALSSNGASEAALRHFCDETPCHWCMFQKLRREIDEKERLEDEENARREDEENALLESKSGIMDAVIPKKESPSSNGVDQTPLLNASDNIKFDCSDDDAKFKTIATEEQHQAKRNLKRSKRKSLFNNEHVTSAVVSPDITAYPLNYGPDSSVVSPQQSVNNKKQKKEKPRTNSPSMKRTILAMTAAANTVMSSPIKITVEDEKEDFSVSNRLNSNNSDSLDSVSQIIESVVANSVLKI